MFEYKIRAGQFLEWARVFDHYYGTPLKNVRDALRRGKSVLLCIDVQGGRQVKKKLPGAVAIFVKTPDLGELRRRLKKRATDSKQSGELRLKTAKNELKQARQYDHTIVNDQLDRAFDELVIILQKIPGLCVR
jgi:guanylate kinase